MMETIGQMMRANKLEDLRKLWVNFTWMRRNRDKRHWFQHDYQFVRREARKARLL